MLKIPKRVLFVRFSAYGDILMCLPALVDFKRKFPHTEVHFLVAHTYADILAHPENLGIAKVHIYRRISGPLGWWEMVKTARHLRALGFDYIFDWQANPRSKLLLALVGAESVFTFDRRLRIHQLEKCYLTLKDFGVEQPKNLSPIRLTSDSEERWAKQALAEIPAFRQKIVLGIGGIWETKLWQTASFLEVVKTLSDTLDAYFVLIGDKRDSQRADELTRGLPSGVLNLVGQTSILQACGVIRLCDLVISNDTSTMHLGWVQGVPTIGIFGSTDPLRTSPLGEKSFAFASTLLPCHPCFSGKCLISEIEPLRCLKRISVSAVVEKSLELLS